MSELKPCPFCGADNGYVDVIPNPFSNDIYSRGHCIKCHAVGTFYMQSYLEGELRPSFEQMAQMATEQWNARPIEDELRKRIAELEAAQRWIPVKEKLPNLFETVLIWAYCDCDGYDRFDLAFNSGLVWVGTQQDIEYEDVTHWMPLPTPPEVTR